MVSGVRDGDIEALKVMILGRPNVGKSTLMNRVVGKKVAIVEDMAGVTRDWNGRYAVLGQIPLWILDTPGIGLEDGPDFMRLIQNRMVHLVEKVDVVLFLVDGKEGLTSQDREVAQWIRRQGVPVVLVANKCESLKGSDIESQAARLGFGSPIPISALHGVGMGGLEQALIPFWNQVRQTKGQDLDTSTEEPILEPVRKPRVVIIGRPNAGKSTLMNNLLGYERALVGPEAGITRDSIEVDISYRGREFIIIDTAGLRKKSQIHQNVERFSCQSSFEALNFSHVACLLIDCTRGIEKQDLTILERIQQEGRGMILGLSKWDQVEDPDSFLIAFKKCVVQSITGGKWVPICPFSAQTGQGLTGLVKTFFDVYERWSRRLSTGQLNRWLGETLQRHPPALVKGRSIRLKYMSQIKSRPPTFALFGNQALEVPDAYKRYLTNALIEDFGFEGVFPRLVIRQTENPYVH